MANALALILALGLLVATLAVAVLRPPRIALALPAAAGALVLVAAGAISATGAGHAFRSLAPTVGFLVALWRDDRAAMPAGYSDMYSSWHRRRRSCSGSTRRWCCLLRL